MQYFSGTPGMLKHALNQFCTYSYVLVSSAFIYVNVFVYLLTAVTILSAYHSYIYDKIKT